mmetsp:Transcript_4110/g.11433  ORF Transcript_4110/g.11433 Transcript_4110/m.11433 type:complete len:439 (+) Transcript_4110:235-1551(+)
MQETQEHRGGPVPRARHDLEPHAVRELRRAHILARRRNAASARRRPREPRREQGPVHVRSEDSRKLGRGRIPGWLCAQIRLAPRFRHGRLESLRGRCRGHHRLRRLRQPLVQQDSHEGCSSCPGHSWHRSRCCAQPRGWACEFQHGQPLRERPPHQPTATIAGVVEGQGSVPDGVFQARDDPCELRPGAVGAAAVHVPHGVGRRQRRCDSGQGHGAGRWQVRGRVPHWHPRRGHLRQARPLHQEAPEVSRAERPHDNGVGSEERHPQACRQEGFERQAGEAVRRPGARRRQRPTRDVRHGPFAAPELRCHGGQEQPHCGRAQGIARAFQRPDVQKGCRHRYRRSHGGLQEGDAGDDIAGKAGEVRQDVQVATGGKEAEESHRKEAEGDREGEEESGEGGQEARRSDEGEGRGGEEKGRGGEGWQKGGRRGEKGGGEGG